MFYLKHITLGSSIFTLDTFITAGKYVLNFTKCAACFMFECQDWNIHSIFRPWKMPSNIFFLISALLTDSIIANGANLQTVLRTLSTKGFSGRIIRPTDSVNQLRRLVGHNVYNLTPAGLWHSQAGHERRVRRGPRCDRDGRHRAGRVRRWAVIGSYRTACTLVLVPGWISL